MDRTTSLAVGSLGLAALVVVSLLPEASRAADYPLTGRDIGCAEVTVGRPRQICEGIAASLTWQWMGHAIIAPGYKPSFEGIRNVYCQQKIGKNDLRDLQLLKNYDPKRRWRPDWRLESGADMLMRIVSNLDGAGNEPITSIFNPQSPDYLLKGKCS